MATQKELRRSVYSFSGNYAARTFIWVVTISRIPDRQSNNPASRAQILANPDSRQDIMGFPESRTVFWSNPDPENTLPDPVQRATTCNPWHRLLAVSDN